MGVACTGEICTGRFKFHRDSHFMDEVTCERSENMGAKNFICFCMSQDFRKAFGFMTTARASLP